MNTGYTLDKDEQILRRISKHWIALAPVVFSTAIIVIVVIIGSYAAARYRSNIPDSISSATIAGVMGILLILALITFAVGIWVYRRNYILLTTKHLIRVEQQGLFHKSVAQLSLSRVQDVSSATPGALPTILGYGTVTIQTAGEEDNFVFTQAPRPSELADACLLAHDNFEASAERTSTDAVSGSPTPAAPAPLPIGPVPSTPPVPAPVAAPPAPTVSQAPVEPPQPTAASMEPGTPYQVRDDEDE